MSSRNGKKTTSIDKILITGASGFVGRNLAGFFSKKYARARIITAARQGNVSLTGDLQSASFWKQIPRDITHIIHLASKIDWHGNQNPAEVKAKNLVPIRNLIKFSKKCPNLKQLIYASSISVYKPSMAKISEGVMPSPQGAYGRAKLEGEKLLLAGLPKNTQVAILRFSSIYGPGQYPKTVLPVMMAHARHTRQITVFGRGKRTQDFLYVGDAVQAIQKAYERNGGGVFNIGSGEAATMKELAHEISKVAGKKVQVRIDLSKKEDYPGYRFNVSKARRILGFKPKISLRQGLKIIKEA